MASDMENKNPDVLLSLLVERLQALTQKLEEYITQKNEQDKDQEARLRILEENVATLKANREADLMMYDRKMKNQSIVIAFISTLAFLGGFLITLLQFSQG